MVIAKTSMFTGIKNTMTLDVTREQITEFKTSARRSIQEIFPNLAPHEREFLLTGTTPEEWNAVFEKETLKEYDRI